MYVEDEYQSYAKKAEEAREHLEKEIGEEVLMKIYPLLTAFVPRMIEAEENNEQYEFM